MIYLQNTYSDLCANVMAVWQERRFPPKTTFTKLERKGRRYWYANPPGGRRRYLGPDSPELAQAIGLSMSLKKSDDEAKLMASALKRAGMPQPPRDMEKTLSDLAWNGFFRMRGVLVRTLVFQSYFPMFSERPADFRAGGLKACGMDEGAAHAVSASFQTGDIDLGQFQSISLAIHDRMDIGFEDALGSDFSRIPALFPGQPSASWRSLKTGVRIDLLAPLRCHMDKEDAFLPAISANAAKVKFLDFLIHDEMPAVILHNSGIPANVPQPARYAIHKLIVSQERFDAAKSGKDMLQALILIGNFLESQPMAIMDAFREAADRGPGWRKRLSAALRADVMPQRAKREFGRFLPKKADRPQF